MQTSLLCSVLNLSDPTLLPQTSPLAAVIIPSSVVELVTLYLVKRYDLKWSLCRELSHFYEDYILWASYFSFMNKNFHWSTFKYVQLILWIYDLITVHHLQMTFLTYTISHITEDAELAIYNSSVQSIFQRALKKHYSQRKRFSYLPQMLLLITWAFDLIFLVIYS